MKKLRIVLLFVIALSLLLVGCNEQENKSGDVKPSGEIVYTESGESKDTIVFNIIEDIVYGTDDSSYRELIADDGEIPDDILDYMKKIVEPYKLKLETATVRYTKSNPAKDNFDLKHDYIVFYQGSDRYNSINFVISTVDIKSTEIPSEINGTELKIYAGMNGEVIAYFNKDDMHIEMTMIGRNQEEIIDILKSAI